jgi:penicillin-binding protein 1A
MAQRKIKHIKVKNKNTMLTIGIIGAVILTLLVMAIGWFWSIILLFLIVMSPLIIRYSGNVKKIFMRFFKKNKNEKVKSSVVKNPKVKKKRKKAVKIAILVALVLGVIGIVSGIGVMIYVASVAPEFNPNDLYLKETTIIYDSENNVIAELGLEKRENVTFDKLPQVLIDAIIATEDSRFYQHNGLDLPRFTKATVGQLTGNSSAGGGSTISMQVVKNIFTSFDQTIIRKLTDIYMAVFKLEKKYTKEEIFEFYVNTPYLGGGAYGVQQAARTYFNKSVSELNLAEASLIAGLFQSPGAYDPFLYPDKAEKRRETVLYLMKRHGYITKEQYEIAKSITVKDMIAGKSSESLEYQGYIDAVIEEVIKKTGYNPYDKSMEIYTNMIKAKQDHANKILSGELFTFRNNDVQTGFAVTESQTGKVIAIGAGRNRNGERNFNYATMIKRQPGSTAKPLFDYGPGFEYNNWSPATYFVDEPYTYSNGVKINNWDGEYWGLMNLRNALKESRNIPALKAFQQVDNKKIVEFVTSLGITPEIDNGKIHEAHAIGGFNGVSPLEMAGAYSAFSNGGYYIEPYTVSKIKLKESGKEIEYKPEKKRVMKDTTAFLITDILKGSSINGVTMAQKTGTSNLDTAREQLLGLPANTVADAWVVGYSPDYAIAMWYGYDETTKEHYMTTAMAWADRQPLFNAIAKGMIENKGSSFPATNDIVKVTVEKETIPLMLPSKYTPDSMKLTEYFIKGAEPTEESPRYSQFENVTGLDGTFSNSTNQVSLSWNAITTPSHLTSEYLNKYFSDAYGSSKDKYLNMRLDYDRNNMGNIGYNVYQKNSSTGALTLLGFTTNTSYTHTLTTSSPSITYVVKTGYSIFKANQSNGSEITVAISNSVLIDLTLNGNATETVSSGSYSDKGVSYTVWKDGVDITTAATKTVTITKDGTTVPSISTPGTYIIKYTISYGSNTKSITRTVIVQ